MTRPRPLAIAAVGALLALAWMLFGLHRVFVDERRDALDEFSGRRVALEMYARASFVDMLRRGVERRVPDLERAATTPGLPVQSLILVRDGSFVLPRGPMSPEKETLWPELLAAASQVTVPSTLLDGRWYVEPVARGVWGFELDAPRVIATLDQTMRERGLFPSEDSHLALDLTGARVAVSSLLPRVESEYWATSAADVRARHRLKTSLLLVTWISALAVALMAFAVQSRKQRYVQLKEDFVAAVSHELRTPLASIRLLAETLERRVQHEPGARDYPARIVAEIDRLTALVENVLSFSRLEKGRLVPDVQLVPLSDLVHTVELEARLATQAPVELETAGLEGVSVKADPGLLRLLFANLTRNACVHNRREKVSIRIAVETSPKLVVLFSDNGPGVAEGDRDRIFDEFARGATSARGSGLGLALCRRIMKAHGGSITIAQSSPDGTTFKMTFPQG